MFLSLVSLGFSWSRLTSTNATQHVSMFNCWRAGCLPSVSTPIAELFMTQDNISQYSWNFIPNQILLSFLLRATICFSRLFMGLFSWKWVFLYKKLPPVNNSLLQVEEAKLKSNARSLCSYFDLICSWLWKERGRWFFLSRRHHNISISLYHIDYCLLSETMY
jgi:hypothetical protein